MGNWLSKILSGGKDSRPKKRTTSDEAFERFLQLLNELDDERPRGSALVIKGTIERVPDGTLVTLDLSDLLGDDETDIFTGADEDGISIGKLLRALVLRGKIREILGEEYDVDSWDQFIRDWVAAGQTTAPCCDGTNDDCETQQKINALLAAQA